MGNTLCCSTQGQNPLVDDKDGSLQLQQKSHTSDAKLASSSNNSTNSSSHSGNRKASASININKKTSLNGPSADKLSSSSQSDKRYSGSIDSSSRSSQFYYSREQMAERNNQTGDYNWLEGRRYHNVEGASYQLPNDIDEVDRLQLQHFILRYAFQSNYQSPLDKSKVQTILDIGCGPGTWTMEMANEFPEAQVTGIDMSPVFPSTIIPSNCRFIQHNILERLPFEDNTFDYVYQRLLMAALTPDDWKKVLKELERVLKPGGYVELIEADGYGGSNGPLTLKAWSWVNKALANRGINLMIANKPGLGPLLKGAKFTSIKTNIRHLPTGNHGGKIGQLLKENEMTFFKAIAPVVIHGAGVSKQDYEEAVGAIPAEVEQYKSYHIFYTGMAQKAIPKDTIAAAAAAVVGVEEGQSVKKNEETPAIAVTAVAV